MTFVSEYFEASMNECIGATLDDADFMAEYRRLTGSRIGLDDRPPIVKMVDRVCGHVPAPDEKEARAFYEFVRDYVWLPVFGPAGTVWR